MVEIYIKFDILQISNGIILLIMHFLGEIK